MKEDYNKDLKYIYNNIGNCKLISSFSCLGKTYIGNKYSNILDLEASWYKWIYNDDVIAKDVEKRKGVTDRIANPNYPANYFKSIAENLSKYDVILITPELYIRELLHEYNIKYYYAFPTDSKFVIDRAFSRGNNEYFAFGLEKSYKNWFPKNYESVLWVKENEYLENVLKDENII